MGTERGVGGIFEGVRDATSLCPPVGVSSWPRHRYSGQGVSESGRRRPGPPDDVAVSVAAINPSGGGLLVALGCQPSVA